MLYGLLLSLYIFVSFLLILIILVQKGKSSMGLGGLGGGSQMLFGGSGGQDLFQKITWGLMATFIGLAIILFFMRSNNRENFRYLEEVGTSEPISAPVTTEHAEPKPELPATEEQNFPVETKQTEA